MRKLAKICMVVLFCLTLASLCFAEASEVISVPVDSSVVISGNMLSRVAVGNPRVADVQLISATQFLVNGKSAGRTNILVWDGEDILEYTVEVTDGSEPSPAYWFDEVSSQLHRWGIDLRQVGPVAVLEGETTTTAQREAAELLTRQLFTDVANLIQLSEPEPEIPDDTSQIQLLTYIVELNEGTLRTLGVDWQRTITADQFGLLNVGTVAQLSALINKIELLEQTGEARVLANPMLLVTSGKPARFLAGGQVPIPLENRESIQIQWRDYGVSLEVTATMEKDAIVIAVAPEVSSLDWENGVHTTQGVIPALRTRRLYTEVRMLPQETLVLGGLYIQEEIKRADKIPLLGSLPIFGSLFRTSSVEKKRTELMILLSAFPKGKGWEEGGES